MAVHYRTDAIITFRKVHEEPWPNRKIVQDCLSSTVLDGYIDVGYVLPPLSKFEPHIVSATMCQHLFSFLSAHAAANIRRIKSRHRICSGRNGQYSNKA